MDGAVFMLATGIIEGAIVFAMMWLYASSEKTATHDEEEKRRLRTETEGGKLVGKAA